MRVTPLEAIIARPHGDPTNRLIRQQWVDWSSSVDRFVVISGCSSGGKSTLIAELGKRGHAVVDEPGRRIVKEELASGGSALPWLDGSLSRVAPCESPLLTERRWAHWTAGSSSTEG